MAKKTGYNIKCENCNKDIYQTKTQYNRALHHFCSNKCQKEYLHNQTYEDRKCEMCETIIHVSKLSKQRFCSDECQSKWQSANIGELNPKYDRIDINCTYCKTPIKVIKSKIEKQNNHFCDKNCRRKWYSEVYSQSEEWKNESRIRATNILKNNTTTTNTAPQKIINQLLDEMKINYENEKNYTYYSVDNYLLNNDLIIEVMGDFWHCNPLKYNTVKQNIQKKNIPRDKAKHTYIKNKYNIEILYLWEKDIINNQLLCKEMILEYINNNGILLNYHSFNYSLDNDKLVLNKNLIIPYQDLKVI